MVKGKEKLYSSFFFMSRRNVPILFLFSALRHFNSFYFLSLFMNLIPSELAKRSLLENAVHYTVVVARALTV